MWRQELESEVAKQKVTGGARYGNAFQTFAREVTGR